MISTRKFKNLAAAITLALSGAACNEGSTRVVTQEVQVPVPTPVPTLFARDPRMSDDGNTVYMQDRRSGSEDDIIALDVPSKNVTTVIDVDPNNSHAYVNDVVGNILVATHSQRTGPSTFQEDVVVFNPGVGKVSTNTPQSYEYMITKHGRKILVREYDFNGKNDVKVIDPDALTVQSLIPNSANTHTFEVGKDGNFLVEAREQNNDRVIYAVENETRTRPARVRQIMRFPAGTPGQVQYQSNVQTLAYWFGSDLIFVHNGQSATLQKPDSTQGYMLASVSPDGLRAIIQDHDDKLYLANPQTGTTTAIQLPVDWEPRVQNERTFYGPNTILIEGDDNGNPEQQPMLVVRPDGTVVNPFAGFITSPLDQIDGGGIWYPQYKEHAVIEFAVDKPTDYIEKVGHFNGSEQLADLSAGYDFSFAHGPSPDGRWLAVQGRKFVPAQGTTPPRTLTEVIAHDLETGTPVPIVSTSTAFVQDARFSRDNTKVAYSLDGKLRVRDLNSSNDFEAAQFPSQALIYGLTNDGSKALIGTGYDPTRIMQVELKPNGKKEELAVH